MSSRITYANASAVLTDWVLENGGEEGAIDYLASWLADGNSMQALCTQYSLTWGVLAAWIRKSPERDGRYRQAMLDRSALRKERLIDGWWDTAAQVPEDAVTHGDVHKARESLAKAEGVFEKGASVSIGSGDGTPKSITVTFVDAVDGRPA